MFIRRALFSGLGLSLLFLAIQSGAKAQGVEDITFEVAPPITEEAAVEEATVEETALESLLAEEDLVEESLVEETTLENLSIEAATIEGALPEGTMPEETVTEASVAEETVVEGAVVEGAAMELANLEAVGLVPVESEGTDAEIAQARRRTRNAPGRRTNDFVGIGVDFGFADDVSFAIISKLSVNEFVAVRPSVLIGDDFSVLVPITYEFSRFTTNISNFQVRPYAGVGAAFTEDDDDSDFSLLLAGGADIPISRRFTFNGQANLGLIGDTDFGVTLGVGYNFGRIFR